MRESFKLRTGFVTRYDAESPGAAERMAREIQRRQLDVGTKAVEGAKTLVGEYELVNETRSQRILVGARHDTRPWQAVVAEVAAVALALSLLYVGVVRSNYALFLAGGLILWSEWRKGRTREGGTNA
jgi:hypothetical protein